MNIQPLYDPFRGLTPLSLFLYYNPNMGVGSSLIEDRFKGVFGGVIGNHKKYDVMPYELLGNTKNHEYNSDQISNRKYEFFNPIIGNKK